MKLTDEKIAEVYKRTFESSVGCVRSAPTMPPMVLDFARAILKEAGVEELERDAERLDWKVEHPEYSLYGSAGSGWVVWDQSNGLVKAGEGKTAREAIDEAMKAK